MHTPSNCTMRTTRVLMAIVAVATVSACAFFFPFGHENLGETRVRAICRFAFACCTPIERQLFANAPFKDEGACVAETLEDQGFGAFVLNIDTLAREAVSRGAAEYDGEAAERCARPQLDAVNTCDVEKLVDSQGQFDFTRFFLLADPGDPECAALASRNYVRGLVDDGDECFSDFDCKDFGLCVDEEGADEDTITTKGECRVPHAEGEECDDGKGCQPGLSCLPDQDAGAVTCQANEPGDEGDDCFVDADCASNVCEESIGGGACLSNGADCVDDVDCPPGDFCNGEFVRTCGAANEISVEVCNGPE